MAIAGTRARLVTFEPTETITARNVQDAIRELEPAAAGSAWMPLTTTTAGGDDVLVFDAGHSLIPTLVAF